MLGREAYLTAELRFWKRPAQDSPDMSCRISGQDSYFAPARQAMARKTSGRRADLRRGAAGADYASATFHFEQANKLFPNPWHRQNAQNLRLAGALNCDPCTPSFYLAMIALRRGELTRARARIQKGLAGAGDPRRAKWSDDAGSTAGRRRCVRGCRRAPSRKTRRGRERTEASASIRSSKPHLREEPGLLVRAARRARKGHCLLSRSARVGPDGPLRPAAARSRGGTGGQDLNAGDQAPETQRLPREVRRDRRRAARHSRLEESSEADA